MNLPQLVADTAYWSIYETRLITEEALPNKSRGPPKLGEESSQRTILIFVSRVITNNDVTERDHGVYDAEEFHFYILRRH